MQKFFEAGMAIVLAFFASGCIETTQEYTLNPDGSGKVTVESIIQPVTIKIGGQEEDPEKQMKDEVKQILEKSSGIEVWKDVAFKRTDNGKIWFKGIAYFTDIAQLDIHNLDMMNISFRDDEKEGSALELEFDWGEGKKDVGKAMPLKLTEEEIANRIKREKAEYQDNRPMMVAFFSMFKADYYFRLPGKVVEVTNLKEDEAGTLRLQLEGTKLIEAMDEMLANEAWVREQVLAGRELFEGVPLEGLTFNEKFFGERAPLRATITGDLQPLFDYDIEVTAAKKSYPELLKELGIFMPIPAALANGGDFKSVKVGGVRFVNFSNTENNIRPFNQGSGYALSLIGELPGSVLKVTGGKLAKAVADNGENLLPNDKWERKIHFPRLSKDKTTVVFEVNLSLPGENVKYLKEVSGSLEYLVSVGVKEVDLGIEEFRAGAQGKELGAVIKSAQKSTTEEEGKSSVKLKLNLPQEFIKSIDFYDIEEDRKLDVSGWTTSGMGEVTEIKRTFKGDLPEKGRILVEIYDKLEKYEIPFKMGDISLIGEPIH